MNILISLFNKIKEPIIKKLNDLTEEIKKEKIKVIIIILLWIFIIWGGYENAFHHRGVLRY